MRGETGPTARISSDLMLNSDSYEPPASPYKHLVTFVATRVKRLGQTGPSGLPYAQLLGEDKNARIDWGLGAHAGWRQYVQDSIPGPAFMGLQQTDVIDLIPSLKVTYDERDNTHTAVAVTKLPCSEQDNLIRTRKRLAWKAHCYAETMHVSAALSDPIIHETIEAPDEPDYDAFLARIKPIINSDERGASKAQEENTMTNNGTPPAPAAANELDAAIPRDEHNQPARSNGARNYARVWQRMNELYATYNTPKRTNKEQHDYIEAAVTGSPDASLKDLGGLPDNDIYERLHVALGNTYHLKVMLGPQPADPPAKTAPKTPESAAESAPAAAQGVGAAETAKSGQDGEIASVEIGKLDKSGIRAKYNAPQRGKDYLMVQGRVLLFRAEHPDWTIETDSVLMTETTSVFKAAICNPEGRIIATGHGRATEAGTKHLGGRFIEKAETAAIGRALALAGFGTDDSLDDSGYVADSPVAA